MRERSGLGTQDWITVAALALVVVAIGIWKPYGWLGIAGLAATIIGLAIAIGQVRLARDQITQAVTVAEATKNAVLTTRAKLVKSELIDAVGQMLQHDRDFFAASRTKDVQAMADHLAGWRDRSWDVVALIDGSPHATEELKNSLIETAKNAAELRDSVLDDPSQIDGSVRRVRNDISRTCGLLGVLKTKLKLDMEEDVAR